MLGRAQPLVVVEGFSGPFDLLVRLIERRELNLLAISLAEVTDQYLASLSASNLRDPEHLSAFLVVAAKLLLNKSTLLLPSRERPPSEPATPDPTDLTARLRVYAAYRAVANALGARVDARLRSYPHPPIAYRPSAPRFSRQFSPTLLSDAFLRALARPKPATETELPSETRMTVAEAIDLLRHALDRVRTVQLAELVGEGATRQRYVATFLAVLELARLGVASAEQSTRFGAITLAKRTAAVDDEAVPTATLRSTIA